MKRHLRLWAVWLVLALLPWGMFPGAGLSCAAAESGAPPSAAVQGGGGCATSAELWNALREDAGGTVALTQDIVLEVEEDVLVSQPVTVLLGEHRIIVPEGTSLSVNGPVHFEGAGAAGPSLEAAGFLSLQNGASVSVAGEGCVAVRAAFVSLYFAELRASGANAAALELTGGEGDGLTASLFSAAGEGSAAVRAPGRVGLLLCRAEAGGVPVVSETGEIVLDGCAVFPDVPGAELVERTAFPGNRLRENGLCVRQGAEREELEALREERLGGTVEYAAYDTAEEKPAVLFHVPARYTDFPAEVAQPGTEQVACSPLPPDWFPLELEEFSIPLHVVGESQPFLQDAQDAGDGAYLRFFREIAGADRLVLWVSRDGGAWQDAAELPGCSVSSGGALLEQLSINSSYRFQLEVEGGPMAGRSNLLEFPFYDEYRTNGGGNRDNDDRGDMGELPQGDFLAEPSALPGEGMESRAESEEGSRAPAGTPSASASPAENGERGREEESSALPAQGTVSAPSGKASPLPQGERKPESPLLWPWFLGGAALLAAGAAALALCSRPSGRHGKGGGRS